MGLQGRWGVRKGGEGCRATAVSEQKGELPLLKRGSRGSSRLSEGGVSAV